MPVKFWFATGGAGFCISRGLALKMSPWARYVTPLIMEYTTFLRGGLVLISYSKITCFKQEMFKIHEKTYAKLINIAFTKPSIQFGEFHQYRREDPTAR